MPADRARPASSSSPVVAATVEVRSARRHAYLAWVLGAVTALLFVVMAMQAAPLEPSVPELQLTFSEAAFRSILAQWQPSGVRRFAGHIAIDFAFLSSYGVFGYVLYRHGFNESRVSGQARAILAWTLPLAAVMDAAENVLHLLFLYTGTVPALSYFVAGTVATAKWALIVGFALATGYHLIRPVRSGVS